MPPVRKKIAENVVEDVYRFLSRYIVLSETEIRVAATWAVAAWCSDAWSRFPHLAVTSPEKRCGKTRFLQLLEKVCPRPFHTASISPAALYRMIEQERPTLLLDEAQSISRRGSESSEVLREILNAGIDSSSVVIRMGGKNMDEVRKFSVYSPKAIALIGHLDGVLADRCLPVHLTRKTKEDKVEFYNHRVVAEESKELKERVEKWTTENLKRVQDEYDRTEPFEIDNDRMADLLRPLQAILAVTDPSSIDSLRNYAEVAEEKNRRSEMLSPGTLLLIACKEAFEERESTVKKMGKMAEKVEPGFLSTDTLIGFLVKRSEEPWSRWSKGNNISPEALANLLRPYEVRSERNRDQSARGYYRHRFETAWSRYTPE